MATLKLNIINKQVVILPNPDCSVVPKPKKDPSYHNLGFIHVTDLNEFINDRVTSIDTTKEKLHKHNRYRLLNFSFHIGLRVQATSFALNVTCVIYNVMLIKHEKE